MKITKVFKLIENNIDDSDFVGQIDISKIKLAESLLQVSFSTDYKLFLNKYGCGDIFGLEIYGIISDPSSDANGIPNVIWITNELRREGLSSSLIPIAEDGEGNYYVIDVSNSNNSEEEDDKCPVLLWEPVSLKSIYQFENFGCFLYDILKEYM
jgi:hypothetical protein